MKKFIIVLLTFIQVQVMAQPKIQGEYYFSRHEMIAGFNFSEDGKFQFYYSYGAVDRNATGTFSVEGDVLILKSDKVAGHDFTIKQQLKQGNGYTLVFEHPNKYLLNDIRCIFFIDGIQQEAYSDSNGEVHVDLNRCDSIYAQHLLFPDILTLVKKMRNDNNWFNLSLNPSLEQVSFKGIDFKIVDSKTITCLPNYLINISDIEFTKQ